MFAIARRGSRMAMAGVLGCFVIGVAHHVVFARQQAADVMLSAADAAVIELPAHSRLEAIDPVSGVGAVLLEAFDADSFQEQPGIAAFYASLKDPLGKPVTVDLPSARAVAISPIFHENARLFVVADDRGSIHLVDPASGEIRSSIKTVAPVQSIIASPDGRYLYYSVGRDDDAMREQSRLACIGAIDMAAATDKGLFNVSTSTDGWDFDLMRSLGADTVLSAISHDGHFLYLSRSNSFPSGIRSCRIDASDWSIRLVKSEHDSTQAYVSTPMGTACQKKLLTPSLSREILTLAHPPNAAITGTPFVVGYESSRGGEQSHSTLVVMSLNTGAVAHSVSLDRVPLSPAAQERRNRGAHNSGGWPIHHDAASGALLLERPEGLMRVSIGALKLPVEPMLGYQVKGELIATVNQRWQVELEPLSSDVVLSLGDAPGGVALEKTTLTWTPGIDDIGPRLIPVTARARGVGGKGADAPVATADIEVDVRADELKLPFAPAMVALDPSATYLAIATAGQNRFHSGGDQREPDRVAVVDVSKRAVLIERQVDFGISFVAMTDGGSVLMCDQDADAIHVLSIAGEDRTVYTKGRPQQIVCVAGRVYIATQGNAGQDMVVLSASDLSPIDQDVLPDDAGRRRGMQSNPLPIGYEGGWLISGLVRSVDMKAVDLVRSAGLSAYETRLDASDETDRFDSSQESLRWGVRLRDGRLVRSSGQTIAQLHDGTGRLLDRHPLALFVRYEQKYDQRTSTNTRNHTLEVIDLATGKSRSTPIAYGHADNSPNNWRFGQRGSNRIFETEEGVGIVLGDRALMLTFSQLGASGANMPLYIAARQSALVIADSERMTLQYEVKGGTQPVTFSLGRALEGVSVDKASGNVTIDPTKLPLDEFVGQMCHRAMQRAFEQPGIGRPNFVEPPETADWPQILSMERAAVKSSMGIDLQGAPAVLRVGLKARDANQQEAVLNHEVLIDVSRERLDAAYAKARAEFLKRQQEQRQQHGAPGPGAAAGDLAAENQRLRDEVERLKGQIELLKQMLEEQKSKGK